MSSQPLSDTSPGDSGRDVPLVSGGRWILTGMSAAGLAVVAAGLPRRGVAVVDNLPVDMLGAWVARASTEPGLAVVDARQGVDLAALVVPRPGRVIFLDASDKVLVRRLAETVVAHPLAAAGNHSAQIAAERVAMAPLRAAADVIVDTSEFDTAAMVDAVAAAMGVGLPQPTAFRLVVSSFGFKYGPQPEADWVVDVRFLRNPFWDPVLRARTGLDAEVSSYVIDAVESQEFLRRLLDTLSFTIERCVSHHRTALHVAVGCTGGRHRSVAVAVAVADQLSRSLGVAGVAAVIDVKHRDVERPDSR